MVPNPLDTLGPLRDEINARLQDYFTELEPSLGITMSADGGMALDWLGEFTLRPAKRIRGALAVVGYEMFGGSNHWAAIDLALVMELLQSYLLIIDDVMDRSQSRRGGPTVQLHYYQWLEERFGRHSDAHNGDMMAVNLAQLAQHLATRLMAGLDERPERILRAAQVVQVNMLATGFGQMDDLLNHAGGVTTVKAIRHMYRLKSSHYTFVNPLQAGAALAGADAAMLLSLREFGLHAGVAFQLQDDAIGMFGDAGQTGKSALDDLREGKLTMLMQHALEHANPDQLAVIRGALGNEAVTEAQHRAVQALLESLGSRAFARRQAQQEAAAAQAVLQAQSGWQSQAVALLGAMVEYVVNREN